MNIASKRIDNRRVPHHTHIYWFKPLFSTPATNTCHWAGPQSRATGEPRSVWMSWIQSKLTHKCVKCVGNVIFSISVYVRIHVIFLWQKNPELRTTASSPTCRHLNSTKLFRSVCWLTLAHTKTGRWLDPNRNREYVKRNGIGLKKKGNEEKGNEHF
jgi:hypothetical protein